MSVHVTMQTPEGEPLGGWITTDDGEHIPDPPADPTKQLAAEIRSAALGDLAATMRTDSERWFPKLHAGDIDLRVFYALGLAGEVGEVANEIKKLVRADQHGTVPMNLGAELADVFTYLMLLADELGIDILAEYRAKAAYNETRWGGA